MSKIEFMVLFGAFWFFIGLATGFIFCGVVQRWQNQARRPEG